MSRPDDHFGLERGRVFQRIEAHRRAQVREQLEILAQAQEAALGFLVERIVVPFGPADRAEQHRVRRMRELHRGFADGVAFGVERGAAHERVLDLEFEPAVLGHPGQHAFGLGHHLRSDTVAGQHQNFVAHGRAIHVRVSSPRAEEAPPKGGGGEILN